MRGMTNTVIEESHQQEGRMIRSGIVVVLDP